MRRLILATISAIFLLVSWPITARPHGGPPATHDILFGSGHISLVTSHGFFTEDRDWAWICEEATGADLAASAVRTPSRWWVGTATGLRTSSDGCNWSEDPALEGQYIWHVLQDVDDPERVWLATSEGLWVRDHTGDAELQPPVSFSIRHMGQREDGALLMVGFDGPQPVADLDGQRIDLPAETGRVEVLTSDNQGRFYLRFPAGLTDRLIRVSEDGAEVLIPVTDLIRDVASLGSNLYVLYRDGVTWSEDDGHTWSTRQGESIRCLRSTSDGFYACPPSPGPAALLYASTLTADPALWQWESMLDFNQVTKNTCEDGSTAGDLCPYLWHIAGEELGVIPPKSEPEVPAITAHQGCGTSQYPNGWLGLLLALAGLGGATYARRCAVQASKNPAAAENT